MARLTIYRSDDAGSPVMSGQVGTLVTLLDACLVNGYTATVTSITRSGSTATVIAPVAHHAYTGQSVTIAGANESDYNGTFTITVINAVTFTYTVPGAPSSPATGSITWKKLAAGWTKVYSGTNKAAYQQGAGSNSNFFRVQDDAPGAGGAREARITGYETMSDVDTGTHPYPTAIQGLTGTIAAQCVRKSVSLDATARSWVVVADARTLYLFIQSEGGGTTAYFGTMFGEIYSVMAGDAYRQMIVSREIENTATGSSEVLDTLSVLNSFTTHHYIDRGHNGTGDPVNVGKHGDRCKGGNVGLLGVGAIPYTNPANGAFYLSRVWIHDSITTPVKSLRGRMRGFWQWLHAGTGVANLEDLIGTGELAGKTFIVIKPGGNGTSSTTYVIETSDTVETN